MMPTHGIIEGPKIGPQLTLLKLVINPQDPQMLLLIHHLLTSKLKLVRKPQMLHISLHISHHHHKLNCKHIVMHHVMKAILLHITGQHHLFTMQNRFTRYDLLLVRKAIGNEIQGVAPVIDTYK